MQDKNKLISFYMNESIEIKFIKQLKYNHKTTKFSIIKSFKTINIHLFDICIEKSKITAFIS
jgi:hypothetical protein